MAAKTVSLADLLLAAPAPAGVRADIDLVARLQERSAEQAPWSSVKGWDETAGVTQTRLEQAFPDGSADFFDMLSDGEGELLRAEMSGHRMNVWKEGDGGTIAKLARLFMFGNDTIVLGSLKLHDVEQGAGKGIRILMGTVKAARMLGMQRLDLKATEAGSYVWAKAGFLPDDGESWQLFRQRVRQRLFKPKFARLLPAAERQRIRAVLDRPDRTAIWDLVDLDQEIGEPKAIYHLVHDVMWWGELHLDDGKQMNRLREYAKSRGAA